MDTINFVHLARIYQSIKEMMGDIPYQIGGEALLNSIISNRLEQHLYSETPNKCANDFNDHVVEIMVSKEHYQTVLDQICIGKWVLLHGSPFTINPFENVIDTVQCIELNDQEDIDLRFVFCDTDKIGDYTISQTMFPAVEMRSDNITWFMQNPFSLIISHSLLARRNKKDDLVLLYVVDYLITNGYTAHSIGHTLSQALPVPHLVTVLSKVSEMVNVRNYIV